MIEGESENIWVDKLQLSAMVVDKEGQFIGQYAKLIKQIKQSIVNRKNMDTFSAYTESWRIAHELYLFLHHNVIIKLKQKFKKDLKFIKMCEKIEEIMERYEDLESNITFDDLKTVKEALNQIISKGGFKEVTFGADDESGDDSYDWV